MRRWIYLSLLLIGLLLVFPASAQESIWFAYFYNNHIGNLSYVTQDGQTQDFSLGFDEIPETIVIDDLVFAHSRPELAYCWIDSDRTQAPTPGSTSLVIRDIPNEQNIHQIDLGLSEDCQVSLYNDDDSLLTVGLLRQYGNNPLANPETASWEILIIDANTGTIINSLNANDPAATNVISYEGGTSDDAFTPVIFEIQDSTLFFAATNWGGTGLSYSFNLNSREILPYENWGASYNRFGNEATWLTRLEAYPAAAPTGPFETQNAVMYADSNGEAKIIYYTADWEIQQTLFINGGQQIAIQLFKAEAPEDPTQYRIDTVKWIVIDREGNESDLLSNADFKDGNHYHSLQVQASFAGYGILETIRMSDTRQTSFRFSLVENGAETLIWEQMTATGGIYFAYTPEMPYQEFPAFPAFDMSSIQQVQ